MLRSCVTFYVTLNGGYSKTTADPSGLEIPIMLGKIKGLGFFWTSGDVDLAEEAGASVTYLLPYSLAYSGDRTT